MLAAPGELRAVPGSGAGRWRPAAGAPDGRDVMSLIKWMFGWFPGAVEGLFDVERVLAADEGDARVDIDPDG